MQYRYFLPAFIALVAAKADVEYSSTCSTAMPSCLGTAMHNAGCATTDLNCGCTNERAMKEALLSCLGTACSADELTVILASVPNTCEDIDVLINDPSGSAPTDIHQETALDADDQTPAATPPSNDPLYTISIIIVPDDPTTPCVSSTPNATETWTLTTPTPTPSPPSIIFEPTTPVNATGLPWVTPSLPVFTGAAGSNKAVGVVVGLMGVLGGMI